MFEGKPPLPPATPGAAARLAEGEPLRQLSWSDLSARLAAARDLRTELDRQSMTTSSFGAPFVQHVAALENDKEAVNPTDLANRKGMAAIEGLTQDLSAEMPDSDAPVADGERP